MGAMGRPQSDPGMVPTVEAPHSAEDGSQHHSLSRIEKTLALIDRNGLGLEIGPSHNPIAPRSAGFKVEILDYMNADALREKFGKLNVDVEEVDFVWSGERIPELVGGPDRYDWIIASHVIEHLPDLLGFLHDCREVLKPEGVVSLVIPDKRYCFDHFRALTTTGEVLDAFEQRRIRPTAGSVFDNMVNCVTLEDQGSWSVDSRQGEFRSVYSFEEARNSWERAKEGYEDAHVWCFTPTSFRLIFQDLTALGLMSFDMIHEFDTAGNEFFVTLGRSDTDPPASPRVALLQQIESEIAESTLAEATGVVTPSIEAPALSLSPKEEKAIAFKRRVVETMRGSLKRWAR
jgi:SAM-dependent methyltransferase